MIINIFRFFANRFDFIRQHIDLNDLHDDMKYLVIGLGNIGSEYEHTRHNIGFDIVDYVANQHQSNFKSANLGSVATLKHRGRQIILLKPSTYMNRSGKSVQYWAQKENIPLERILVVLDDLNLDFGQIRLRGKGSDGGHNGLKDIDQYLTSNYARMRLGIGNTFAKGRQVDHVLGKWDNEEATGLPKIAEHACKAILSFCFAGLQETMSQYNGEIKLD